MPLLLKGSCRCNAVRFEVESHTPVPFMLCYCSICRKQQGGGGFAINLGADYETLNIRGKRSLGVYQAEIETSIRIARFLPASAISAANAVRRSGSTTRPGRIWCIPSPRRSTASCRCRRKRCI